MSLSSAISPDGVAPPSAFAVRPVWLRPVALGLILAVHAALFFVVKGVPQNLAPLDTVDVALVPLGDSAIDQQKVEESKPQDLPPPPPPSPVEPPAMTAPPPQVVAPEAIPLRVEKPKPIAKPKPKRVVKEVEDDRPTPAELREQRRKAEEAAERRRKQQQARQEARQEARKRRTRSAPRQRGGRPRGGMSQASYAGLLAAELRRHTFYPAAARAAGVSGSVGVVFTVGPSGRVISQSVTRSSGNAALDGAAHGS